MKHNFSYTEISKAAIEARKKDGVIRSLNHIDVKAILDALPDPAGEWEQCAWDEFLTTDERVKVEYAGGAVFEGVPDGISEDRICLAGGFFIPYKSDANFYRIPAPVQHPDPAEHPVIIDEAGRPWFSAGLDEYHSPHQHNIFRNPRDFETWTPGKVVEDDR